MVTQAQSPVLDHLADLADPTRVRLLRVLEAHELTVAELQAVLQLPQSTVSRHLKVLGEGGWIGYRSDGASNRYRFQDEDLPLRTRRVWGVVREDALDGASARADDARVRAVLAQRRSHARSFFATQAGQWDRLREELFGRRSELLALLGLLDPQWAVGDLGCGAGHFAAAVAPFVRRVVAVDESEEMLAAARERLAGFDHVEVRHGELELLPLSEAELDLAAMGLVLPFLPEPARAIAEAARALVPGGRILIVDLQQHDRVEFEETMGHMWLGFTPSQLQGWLVAAGLARPRLVPLSGDPKVKGPGLLVASAVKPAA